MDVLSRRPQGEGIEQCFSLKLHSDLSLEQAALQWRLKNRFYLERETEGRTGKEQSCSTIFSYNKIKSAPICTVCSLNYWMPGSYFYVA